MEQNTTSSQPRNVKPERANAVADLGLPARVLNSLRRHGISMIEQLIMQSAEDLQFDVRGLGPGGIKEIKAALARRGLSLAGMTDPACIQFLPSPAACPEPPNLATP